ncbi:MAG: response regulator [Anaerolineae bacterium]|nr:response regulator [Anaerolineae bacterium]
MPPPKIKVLLIEDDEVDREAVLRTLPSKYTLDMATTGYGGLEAAQSLSPDVVLLDYRLPDIDGIDILSQLLDQKLPVIILTIEENPELIVNAMKQGAFDYMVKRHLTSTALDHAITNAIEKLTLKKNIEEKQLALIEQAKILEKRNQQIRDLASALTLAQQQERRQIAQTLHDNLQQILHGIHVRTLLLNSDLPSKQQATIEPHIEEMENLIDQALEVIRTLSVDLSPPLLKGEGLDVAFEWLASQMKRRHGLTITLEGEANCNVDHDDVRVLIFQMVRELLFNVVKHAGVEAAHLKYFTEDGFVKIKVIDNGSGFDASHLTQAKNDGSFGLYSIQERLDLFGGNLEINSLPNNGTTIMITIPQQSSQFHQLTV